MTPNELRKVLLDYKKKADELQRRLDVCRQMNDMLFAQNQELSEYIRELERICKGNSPESKSPILKV